MKNRYGNRPELRFKVAGAHQSGLKVSGNDLQGHGLRRRSFPVEALDAFGWRCCRHCLLKCLRHRGELLHHSWRKDAL